MARTSTAYRGTVQLVNGQPVGEGAELVKRIRWYYSFGPGAGSQQRVKLAGRFGSKNPNYKPRATVRLQDADRADVYVYAK